MRGTRPSHGGHPVTAATLPAQPSPFAVLRNGRFVRLWTAQLVSTIGDALTSLAAGIMVFADVLRALVVVTIPFLISGSIIWLYVLVMVSASITQFFSPANESVLPEIASEEELGAANAIM